MDLLPPVEISIESYQSSGALVVNWNEGNQSTMVNKKLQKRGSQSPGMASRLYFSEAEDPASRLSCNFGFFMASRACKYE